MDFGLFASDLLYFCWVLELSSNMYLKINYLTTKIEICIARDVNKVYDLIKTDCQKIDAK